MKDNTVNGSLRLGASKNKNYETACSTTFQTINYHYSPRVELTKYLSGQAKKSPFVMKSAPSVENSGGLRQCVFVLLK